MKKLILVTAAMALALSGGSAFAFHDGGVAYCAGCHTMHNSVDGQTVVPGTPQGVASLLIRSNPTDTCLRCHANYGQMAGGNGYGAGGDFYWVTKTWTWESHGTQTSLGDNHGHNVISPQYGIGMDQTHFFSPGGDYSREYLTCTACHDPHGNGNFRLLFGVSGGTAPQPNYDGNGYTFTEPAPLARGNSRYTNNTSTRGEIETNTQHTVYKSGMSEWCGNCHTNFHDANTTNYVHPTSESLDEYAAIYNAYVSSTDLTGGVRSTAYWGLVPFEAVNVDLATVDTYNYTQGPEQADQVMCLTCHRSHASAFDDATRWDMHVAFISESVPGVVGQDSTGAPIFTGGATQEDVDNKYYNYTFEHGQRSLCNKCHQKDYGDDPNQDPHMPAALAGVR